MKHPSLLPILLGAVLLLGGAAATANEPPASAGSNEGSAAEPLAPPAISPTEALLGTWTANFRRSLAQPDLSEAGRARIVEFADEMRISVTFGEGGIWTLHASLADYADSFLGSYEVLEVEGNTMTIRTTATSERSEEPTVSLVTVTVEDNDTLAIQELGANRPPDRIYYERTPAP